MVFDTYEFTSRGGRSYNEDSAGSRTDGEHGIFVVADGLGGHSFGELASAAVRDALLEGFPCPPSGLRRRSPKRISACSSYSRRKTR